MEDYSFKASKLDFWSLSISGDDDCEKVNFIDT
jgi:hypothetical protein